MPDLVPDGTRVALGGTWLSSRPMAAVRELLRAGRRDLHVVALTGSLDVDLLVGAGAAEAVSFCFVSLGPFGLAPRFRAALETGAVRADEHSGHGLTVALEAASRGLDFMPFYGPVGTSLADRYPTVPSPVTGAPVQVAPAERPDVAVLHAEAATPDGHVLLAGALGVDVVTARAARTVVVTAERIVDRLPASGARYLAPAEVHHVVEAPWGAHPLAHVPEHGMDWRSLLAYADAATTPEGFAVWLAADLAGSEDARRAAIGPERRAALRASGRGGPLEAPPGARPATATGDVAPTSGSWWSSPGGCRTATPRSSGRSRRSATRRRCSPGPRTPRGSTSTPTGTPAPGSGGWGSSASRAGPGRPVTVPSASRTSSGRCASEGWSPSSPCARPRSTGRGR
ncbi:MAG: hypothetical protein M5U14_09085 [Acidimicrobiia bacterium]|nr:hypothetical protein [Acidimicrobiia bacterium]